MNKWYFEDGVHGDVVLSSRVRLARNLSEFPFPDRMSDEKRRELSNIVCEALRDVPGVKLRRVEMTEIADYEAVAYAERHLISPEFAAPGGRRTLLLNEDETLSIMICEEDHIRIQALGSGFALDEIFETANKIDDILDRELKYAFDERLGYLTSCPTNLGTGMRASVFMHLPALSGNNKISRLASTVSKIGMTIRGSYGEGTGAKGDIYRLGNQVSLGISERAALDNLKAISLQLATRERSARDEMMKNVDFEDRIFRAYGILTTARLLNTDEMMELLSYCRTGAILGIIPVKAGTINELLVTMQPANLFCAYPETKGEARLDELRAMLIREKLTVNTH